MLGSDGGQDDTPFDGSGLLLDHIKTRAELDDAEFRSISKVYLKYLSAKPSKRRAPFSYAWLLELHSEMFGQIWSWAGKIRTTEKTIGIAPEHIPMRLGGLCLDIESWPPNEQLFNAVTIHHKAVLIHPFENGNGRWARLLANIWLRRAGHAIVEWPQAELEENIHPLRCEYVEALRKADNYDLGPLIELHRRYLS